MIAHRSPGILRTSSVSVKQFFGWCERKPIPAAAPPPPVQLSSGPPTAAPQQPPARVLVQAAADQDAGPSSLAAVSSTVVVPTPVVRPLPPSNRSFFDVLKFNGPGPELINGRLAMIGILAAARTEALTEQTLLQQAQGAPLWVWGGLLVVVWASMVPLLKGARHEAFGVFSPRAEITNGRAAMLGFAILVALEYKAGVPFF